MRTVRELRLAGFLSFVSALAIGLFFAFLTHLLVRGRFGWEDFNLPGLVEGLAFLVFFALALVVAKKAVRVPCISLLSAGLVAPYPARALAEPVPQIEAPQAAEARFAVVLEEGRPVAVINAEGELVPLDEAPVVAPEVAASELGALFWREPVVFVAEGEQVLGAISRERFIQKVAT